MKMKRCKEKWKKAIALLLGVCMMAGTLAMMPKSEAKAGGDPVQVYVSPGQSVTFEAGQNNIYVRDSNGNCVHFTAYYYDVEGNRVDQSTSSTSNDDANGNINETVYADYDYTAAVCEQIEGLYYVHVYPFPIVVEEEAPVDDGSGCSHLYGWEIKEAATETTDAVLALQCSRCGHVLHHMTEANSAFRTFNQNAASAIKKAPANGTVILDTNMWTSFQRSVLSALTERTDVTLVIKYRYEGRRYTVTIPAGSDVMSLIDENGYCGFRFLDSKFAGSELTVG